ncbi:GNAT family N-acetyltransferase [Poseidonocella sp. HB161398]|uniref:GNAT family N-acetyltransferase n=1 Tax=Poseidonocella sp. HB161398 TaxID=2320855 RepID=UPI001107AC1D|nr:N-acetyltransferase [Poseidonocella sp. HB161398]
MLEIRTAEPADHTEISVLLVSTFGQNNEHRLIESLRKSGQIALELVAVLDGRIVGHVCFSKFDVPADWWALAPVSVTTSQQSRGIGSELVRFGLDRARQMGCRAVVVVGNPVYYRRFGFVFDGPAQLSSPYPEQYTGLYPIDPSTASASVALRYPQAFEEV